MHVYIRINYYYTVERTTEKKEREKRQRYKLALLL